MIRKIIFSLILFCLLVAISIKIFDSSITRVQLGTPFLSFMNSCNLELNEFKIEIPSIPSIPKVSNLDVNFFEGILNAFISFVNGLTTLLNFVITFFNVIIQLLQFIFIVLKNLITFRDNLINQ